MLLEIETPATILIAAVVWGVLYPAAAANGNTSGLVNFVSLVEHAFNAPIIFTEFIMNGLLFRRAHLVFGLFWGAAYLIVTFIIQAVRQGQHLNETPPYAFLTASSALLAAWVVGLMLVLLLFFTCAYQVNRLKIRHAAEDLKEEGVEMPVAKIDDSEARWRNTHLLHYRNLCHACVCLLRSDLNRAAARVSYVCLGCFLPDVSLILCKARLASPSGVSSRST